MVKSSVPSGPSSELPLVVAATAACEDAAAACAAQLGGRLLARAAWERADPPPVVVWWDEDGPGLRGPPAGASVRRPPPPAHARPGRDLLLRALGRPLEDSHVIDATAGWGVDAGVMAAAGAHVLLLERSPTMALLLAAALARWQAAGSEAGQRMAVVAADALDRLAQGPPADAVYLDPLYAGRTDRTTSAAELRWLRAVDAWSPAVVDDEAALLNVARAAAMRRVVVKRARAAAPLGGVAPSGSIGGRTTRYDIYPGARRPGA